jgi:hypothetical protein
MTKPTHKPAGRPKLPDADRRDLMAIRISAADIKRIDALRLNTIPPMPLRQWCYAAIMMMVTLAEQRNEEANPKVGLDMADEDERVGFTT